MCLLSSSRASASVISFPLHSLLTSRREASTSGSSGIPVGKVHTPYPRPALVARNTRWEPLDIGGQLGTIWSSIVTANTHNTYHACKRFVVVTPGALGERSIGQCRDHDRKITH